MDVRELEPGLWSWTAGGATCLYVETEGATVLVDPVVPRDEPERFFRALDRDVERRGLPVVIVLTTRERLGADELAARYGARVHSPPSAA